MIQWMTYNVPCIFEFDLENNWQDLTVARK
jgi:hypothetical protein